MATTFKKILPLTQSFKRTSSGTFFVHHTLQDGQGLQKAHILDDFQHILKEPSLLRQFCEFLKKNQCVENLLFWIEVELFKDDIQTPRPEKTASEIYDRFLHEKSLSEINLDADLKQEMDQYFLSPNKTSHISRDIFSKQQKFIWDLMLNNSVPKFLQSDDYRSWKELHFHRVLEDLSSAKFSSVKLSPMCPRRTKGMTLVPCVSRENFTVEKYISLVQLKLRKIEPKKIS